jgi:DNA-binding NtrC family response regulator
MSYARCCGPRRRGHTARNLGFYARNLGSLQDVITRERVAPHQGVVFILDQLGMLLADLIMPEMNGRDLSKEITALFPEIMCLFMSGYTKNVIAHQNVLDKGVHFIQKPFSMQNLAVKVREVMDTE